MILPALTPEELSRSVTGSAWSDLEHAITIALRRGGTESQIVELLSRDIVRYDQWGRKSFEAKSMGRLAGARLWGFINGRQNPAYVRPSRTVAQAGHVTAWDDATSAGRRRIQASVAQAQQDRKARQRTRAEAQAQATRAELSQRWDLNRWRMDEAPAAGAEPARQVHAARPPAGAYTPAEAAANRAVAIALAKEAKRARRRENGGTA